MDKTRRFCHSRSQISPPKTRFSTELLTTPDLFKINMKTARTLLLSLVSLAAVSTSQGATGMFGSFLFVDTNQNAVFNGPGEFYGANEPDPDTLTALHGANLGSFVQGSSVIISGEILTFKNGGGDVFSQNNVNWRVYEISATPGSFANFNLGFTSNATFNGADGQSYGGSGDQKWAQAGSTPNILSGLLPGDYKLEVYFSGNGNEGTFFNNNGGPNYIANFSVTPEPSKALLTLFGIAGVALRRRR